MTGRRAGWAIAAATAGVVLLAVTVGSEHGPDPDLSRAEEPAPAAATGVPMAQSYSPYCQTPQGVCTLPSAQPIGTPCDCNGTPGRVVP